MAGEAVDFGSERYRVKLIRGGFDEAQASTLAEIWAEIISEERQRWEDQKDLVRQQDLGGATALLKEALEQLEGRLAKALEHTVEEGWKRREAIAEGQIAARDWIWERVEGLGKEFGKEHKQQFETLREEFGRLLADMERRLKAELSSKDDLVGAERRIGEARKADLDEVEKRIVGQQNMYVDLAVEKVAGSVTEAELRLVDKQNANFWKLVGCMAAIAAAAVAAVVSGLLTAGG